VPEWLIVSIAAVSIVWAVREILWLRAKRRELGAILDEVRRRFPE
jgi:hypothetical protein